MQINSQLPGLTVRSGVLGADDTTGVYSASSGSSPVILILHSSCVHTAIKQSISDWLPESQSMQLVY